MDNSADPDQLAKQKPADLDLHCLLKRINPVSAGQGLSLSDRFHFLVS